MKSAVRGLTWLQGTALYVGAVLGTGVIALPALAAKTAGPASLLAWLALILLSIPLAATFSALGARYPDAGGVATYAKLAFGPYPAATVGWCFLFAVPVGAPAAAIFAGAYVQAAVGGGASSLMLTAFALVLGIALVNAFGVTISGKVQVFVAGLLIAFLVIAVCASLPHLQMHNLHPFAPHGWLAVGIIGTAAALRLLEAGTWARRAAFLALVFDILLLATTRLYLLWSAGIAGCAVIYVYLARKRSLMGRETA